MMNQLINSDKTEAVIQATIRNASILRTQELNRSLKEYINKKTGSSILTFEITGMPFINERMDSSILHSQLYSITIAIIFVFFCMAFILHSFVGGFIGLIPIGFTLLVIFGVMGLTNIPLNIATVLVGSISIGIGIDYPIHFIYRFKREYAKNKTELDALNNTLKTTGKAILINVISVMMGFIVLVFANLIPLQNFGILIAITMISSGTATLTILPAIILLTKANFILGKKNTGRR